MQGHANGKTLALILQDRLQRRHTGQDANATIGVGSMPRAIAVKTAVFALCICFIMLQQHIHMIWMHFCCVSLQCRCQRQNSDEYRCE